MRRKQFDGDSDAALLRASARDGSAFAEFYERSAAGVLRYFLARTACAQVAADLTAETFAQAFSSRRRFRDMGVPATAWLYKIARRQLSHFNRHHKVASRARHRLSMDRPIYTEAALDRVEEMIPWRRKASYFGTKEELQADALGCA